MNEDKVAKTCNENCSGLYVFLVKSFCDWKPLLLLRFEMSNVIKPLFLVSDLSLSTWWKF